MKKQTDENFGLNANGFYLIIGASLGIVLVSMGVAMAFGQETPTGSLHSTTFYLEGSHIDESIVNDVVDALGYDVVDFDPIDNRTVIITVVFEGEVSQ